ncbi:unnamed protein product [Zymoseptoria tritici ST99CH_1E4]|uniref:Uncharacterized protein n=1 Tax=Zymoseptoria tritici ST99CH_1E4 TaxID=1276532 RepID=A0A2H1GYI8_ZYMTR|nr:unnamed protein product [Zymoseptoria tritici ST99CH_1E4]
MPPIIQDSEDEGDNEDFTLGAENDQPDETNARQEKSSLSTGSLNRQIADAGRGLFDSASDHLSATHHNMKSSTTPAAKKADRRYTTVPAVEPVPGPRSSAKRAKSTLDSYASRSQQQARSQDQLAAFRDDFLPDHSQLPMFAEHSAGAHRSSALPTGTMFQHFAEHEPTVMFRDSGSTVAYNESSQQRLVEQALNQENVPPPITEIRLPDLDKPDSSPFPWSNAAESQTPKRGGDGSQQQELNGNEKLKHGEGAELPAVSQQISLREVPENADESLQAATVEGSGEVASKAVPDSAAEKERQPASSSPIVSVPRVRKKSVPADEAGTQKSAIDKKRKAQAESSEPLNSEDLAIGLPKERYQPRPSRRRSTAVVERPVDYSVVPEKAAKKRRKTTNANATTTQTEPPQNASHLAQDTASVQSRTEPQPETSKTTQTKVAAPKDKLEVIPSIEKQQPAPAAKQIDRGQARETLKDLGFMLRSTDSESTPVKPPATKAATPASAKRAADAAAFAMPPPSSQASRKSRRSHTTIFEDHVDLSRVQKSPSLSQQQAKRQATLEPVSRVASQSTRKKQQTVVHDEDDDEDELSRDPISKEPAATKKPGRPGKSKPEKVSKSAEKVLDESEVDSDDDDIVQPQKRGRPAKSKDDGKAKSTEKIVDESEVDSNDEDIVPPKRRGRPAKGTDQSKAKSAEKVLDESESDENEEDIVQPKKRGRPATKAKDQSKAKSAEKVLEDSEAEPEEDDIVVPPKKTIVATKTQSKVAPKSAEKVLDDSEAEVDDEEEQDDEPPRKKARGRPAKSSAPEKPKADISSNKENQPGSEKTNPKSVDATKEAMPAKSSTSTTADKPLPKPNPNSHSPIKPTSKVIHRVGLNRMQRVQPLLKIVRPPAPARQR